MSIHLGQSPRSTPQSAYSSAPESTGCRGYMHKIATIISNCFARIRCCFDERQNADKQIKLMEVNQRKVSITRSAPRPIPQKVNPVSKPVSESSCADASNSVLQVKLPGKPKATSADSAAPTGQQVSAAPIIRKNKHPTDLENKKVKEIVAQRKAQNSATASPLPFTRPLFFSTTELVIPELSNADVIPGKSTVIRRTFNRAEPGDLASSATALALAAEVLAVKREQPSSKSTVRLGKGGRKCHERAPISSQEVSAPSEVSTSSRHVSVPRSDPQPRRIM